MDEPIKVKILEKLIDILHDITPDNGYYCDLSGSDGREHVFVGVPTVSSSDPLPIISILESEEETSNLLEAPPDNDVNIHDWELLLSGFVATDYQDQLKPQRIAYRLLSDIKRRLFAEKRIINPVNHQPYLMGLGYGNGSSDQIMKFGFNQGVVRPPEQSSEHIFFFLRLTFTIKESVGV